MKGIILGTMMVLLSLSMMGQVRIYPLPEKDGPARMNDYEVSVCPAGSTHWQSVPTLRCDVNTRNRQQASYAEFDMQGEVCVRVKRLDGKEVTNANVAIRPHSKDIAYTVVDGTTIELRLTKSEYLSVEFDDDHLHNLHLFANPLFTEEPDFSERTIIWQGENAQDVFVKEARLIYFAPGVHKPKDLPSEEIKIPSNCTVYLAPGAVVKARLIVDHAENVRIIGRGIIDHPLRGIEITFSKNVLVDGPTILNPKHYTVYGGQSEDITIRHLKAFSAMSWSDGIDLMCCRNVTIEDVFLRNSDDCIALYNHRWWYWGGTEGICVRRATLWADVAHPVNIGSHGDDRSDEGETLRDVLIEDCDVLYAKTNSVLNFSCGDKNWIRDITFRDIRVERVDSTALIGMAILFSAKYNRAPGNGIDYVTFENVRFTGDPAQLRPDFFRDYDATRRIGKHIVIK